MIIECPKCKTKFEVEDSAIVNNDMKFQCSECAYIWNQHIKDEEKHIVENEDEKLPSILTEEENAPSLPKQKKWFEHFYVKNIGVFFMAIVLFAVVIVLAKYTTDSFDVNDGSGVFDSSKKNNAKKLYIEIVKPLTLTKEGSNEYIIIRGFVYNPTSEIKKVPKLVIRLENNDERVLQEQEREIEVKELAPLEKTDFMFKVFKFSSQVGRVIVDFADESKI